MQRTSNIAALKIAASFFGKDIERDREFLQEKVNEVRMLFWKDKAAREIMFRQEACECVRQYRDDCATGCSSTYLGVTFPVNVTLIQRLEYQGRQVERSNDRIESRGCRGGCLEFEVLPTRVVLSHDFPQNNKSPLIVRCRALDKNKIAGIEYIATDGTLRREDLKLRTSGTGTGFPVKKVTKLTLPERCDVITVETNAGSVIDTFHPSIISPSRLRARISGVPNGAVVSWFGFFEPFNVMFDSDMVEFDNPLDWKNAFMFLSGHFQTGKNAAETFAYKAALQMMTQSNQNELEATQETPIRGIKPKTTKVFRRFSRLLRS